jgi:hypothetical protein
MERERITAACRKKNAARKRGKRTTTQRHNEKRLLAECTRSLESLYQI